MKLAVFSSHDYDKEYLEQYKQHHEVQYFEQALDINTVNLIKDLNFNCVCVFVNDDLNEDVLSQLKKQGIKLVALRCAGFNNVDINAAHQLGISVVRVPAYSPNSVAEHAVALMLTLNRKTHKAYNKITSCNFSLDGLMGFDLHGKTAGIIGTGRIGTELVKILSGFGMKILASDLTENPACIELGVNYVSLNELIAHSDIISLHCPLTTKTNHIINRQAIKQMKQGVMLINTSRGAVLDTVAVIEGLRNKTIGYLGIDVYEYEADLFFTDMSGQVVDDHCFQQLQHFDNVLITGHQAFFTQEAMTEIAKTTFNSLTELENNLPLSNSLKYIENQ